MAPDDRGCCAFSAPGKAGTEGEGRLDPCGDAQRVLVLAIAPDYLEAQRQAARTRSGGDGDRRHARLGPQRTEARISRVGQAFRRLSGRGNGGDRIAALEERVEPASILVSLGARLGVLLGRDAVAAVEELDQVRRK